MTKEHIIRICINAIIPLIVLNTLLNKGIMLSFLWSATFVILSTVCLGLFEFYVGASIIYVCNKLITFCEKKRERP